MTKKHFQALADALKDTHDRLTRIQASRPVDCADALMGWRQTVNDVADVCAQTNPRFNRARFLKACGVEDYTIIGYPRGMR